ncbi:hypothetical protein ALI144C_30400 [Actinosynnema sp. ALI-1.44]|uniref:hypothetical protein n=1 Tax=Actinosynnema sp. ALI-1.44 TaxID=1933779 RepID=UPI00097CB8C3|nr:hypothetical protein [Actinosynnema sp. ALI-1.44]ONI77756.1 hypothetical protein ALI144C_30400 [Actinosynnema sp. ALI-1.44]
MDETTRRQLDAVLRQMAAGPDKLLAEMATQVRSGRMTLREAASGSAYREIFVTAAQHVTEAMRGTSHEDLVRAANQQPVDEPPTRREPEPVADDGFDEPIMRAAPPTRDNRWSS